MVGVNCVLNTRGPHLTVNHVSLKSVMISKCYMKMEHVTTVYLTKENKEQEVRCVDLISVIHGKSFCKMALV